MNATLTRVRSPGAAGLPLARGSVRWMQPTDEAPGHADTDLAICSGCGVVLNRHDADCSVCSTPYASPPATIERADPYWVGVRVTVECRACGFEAPVNELVWDGSVLCGRCGIEQRFDPAWWNDLVADARAVGDLGGPRRIDLTGVRNDDLTRPTFIREISEIGRTRTFVRSISERRSNEPERAIEASPGCPLCWVCRKPLVIIAHESDRLTLSCSDCDARRHYRLPADARKLGGLVGALADAYDVDQLEVKLDEDGTVVRLRCPACAAPLASDGELDTRLTCSYCKATCRISTRVRLRVGHEALEPGTWWLLISGSSDLRRSVEAAVRRAERRAALQSELEAERKAFQRAPDVLLVFALVGFTLGLYFIGEVRNGGGEWHVLLGVLFLSTAGWLLASAIRRKWR
jgi:hypothetical protein